MPAILSAPHPPSASLQMLKIIEPPFSSILIQDIQDIYVICAESVALPDPSQRPGHPDFRVSAKPALPPVRF